MLTAEPKSFILGTTVTWTKSLPDYPASDGWVLSYSFAHATDQQVVVATADGDNHLVTIALAASLQFVPGNYHWQSFAAKGGERFAVESGVTEVIQDYTTQTDGFDGRSTWEKQLDALYAAAEGRASKTQLSYSISTATGSRSVSSMSYTELITNIRRIEAIVRREAGDVGRGRLKPRFR